MKRNMIIPLIVLLVILFVNSASANTFEFDLLPADDTIRINNIDGAKNTIVKIKPYSMSDLTVDLINNSNNVLYKVYSEREEVPYLLKLSDRIESGKYLISFIGKNEEKYVFFKANAIDNLLSEINSASTEHDYMNALLQNGSAIVGNKEVFNGAEKCLRLSKPKGGYSATSLVNTYTVYEGLYNVSMSTLTFDEFFSLYSPYIAEEQVQKYNLLTEKEKKEVAKCLDAIEFGKVTYNYAIDAVILISKIHTAVNFGEIEADCLSFFETYGISLTNYNKLKNNYYKESVFNSIFGKRYSISNATELISIFNSACEQQTSNISTESGRGGDGSVRNDVGTTISNQSKPVLQAPVFSDINNHWAENSIIEMAKLGILNGFEDGTFQPDKSVTRAELVKIIVSACKYNIVSEDVFKDVKQEQWYYKYVSTAFQMGLIKGMSPDCFMPDEYITREDVASIIYRTIGGAKKSISEFADEEDISDYAKESVSTLKAMGIIQGSNGKFYPKSNMTRAEVSAIIQRVLLYNKGA